MKSFSTEILINLTFSLEIFIIKFLNLSFLLGLFYIIQIETVSAQIAQKIQSEVILKIHILSHRLFELKLQ